MAFVSDCEEECLFSAVDAGEVLPLIVPMITECSSLTTIQCPSSTTSLTKDPGPCQVQSSTTESATS